MNLVHKTNKGFSLIEILIAAGLFSFFVLQAASFFTDAEKNLKKTQVKAESLAESMITERLILRDIWRAKPSYNVSCLKDDKGKLFFSFSPGCENDCGRSIVLNSASKSFSFIVTNIKTVSAGTSLPYKPVDAFTIGGTQATYVSLNKSNILRLQTNTPWKVGNLIYVYSDSYIEETGPCGNWPHQEGFVGFVRDVNASRLEKVDITGIYEPNFRDEGQLLLDHKQVLGLSNNILIMPIKIVTYRLKPSISKQLYFDLYRYEYQYLNGQQGYSEGKRIALGIKKVSFSRKSISITGINVSVGYN